MTELESVLFCAITVLVVVNFYLQHKFDQAVSDRRYLKGVIFDVAHRLKKLSLDNDGDVIVAPVVQQNKEVPP